MRLVTSPFLRFSILVSVLASIFAIPIDARAQYMYLDSNGDGVNTAADVITATGTTTVRIFIRTNQRRDGSVATCSSGDGDLTINSYEVGLRAVGGTVTFANATNLQAGMGLKFGNVGNSSEYYIGYGGGTILPPGEYLLAQVVIVVTSGTPSIQIVPKTSIIVVGSLSAGTQFGCMCSGIDFDNTLKLGSDWFDVDGLAFSSGGGTNQPPTFEASSPMSLPAGSLASQDLVVNDPDNDLVSLSMTSGPDFATLTPLSQDLGRYSSRLHLAPRRGATGTYTATFSAADAINSASASVPIEVTDGGDHLPSFVLGGGVSLLATTVRRVPLEATDSDGDPIQLSLIGAPAFASLEVGASGPAARRALLVLRPTLCDVGHSDLTIRASTGGSGTDLIVPVDVVTGAPVPTNPVRSFPSGFGYLLDGLAQGDFNRDGHEDVVAVIDNTGKAYQVFLGDGQGGFAPQAPVPLPTVHYHKVGAGDWNGDGNADLMIGGFSETETLFMRGHGDGTFDTGISIPGLISATDFRSADLNGDGTEDLVVAGEGTGAHVVMKTPGGSVAVAFTIPTNTSPKNVAIGDFNLDGQLDVALSLFQPRGVQVYLGHGDGTFDDPHSTPLPDGVIALREGDFDRDGRLDLMTSLFNAGQIYFLRGDGTGQFAPSQVGQGPDLATNIVALDWNLDGFEDIYVGSDDAGPAQIWPGRGNGTLGAPLLIGAPTGTVCAVADFNGDLRPDVAASAGNLSVVLNSTPAIAGVAARGFSASNRRMSLNSSSNAACIRVEPIDGTFDVTTVDLASVRLRSDGTGTANAIPINDSKSSSIGDTDHNGVNELGVCFSVSQMASLFSNLRGLQDVTPRLDGALLDGRRFCTPVTLTIIGKGSAGLAARVEPNPLNPEGTLRFATKTPGAVSVRLFDVNGRLVRTVWNARSTVVGDQEVRIDGKDAGGRALRSGVYFYRIEGGGADETGRFTVLK